MAKTLDPMRIGTWPSPPVPWLMGGSGGGISAVSESPTTATAVSAAWAVASVADVIDQPAAAVADPATIFWGDSGLPLSPGTPTADAASWGTWVGLAPTSHAPPWGAGAPVTSKLKWAAAGATVM